MVTVYAALVEGLKPSTRGRPQSDQMRGKGSKVEVVSAQNEQKALNKLTGRNQGWQVVYYETVEH